MLLVGNRKEVFGRKAKQTAGGLKKKDLIKNKRGKIVSKKLHKKAIQKYNMTGGNNNNIRYIRILKEDIQDKIERPCRNIFILTVPHIFTFTYNKSNKSNKTTNRVPTEKVINDYIKRYVNTKNNYREHIESYVNGTGVYEGYNTNNYINISPYKIEGTIIDDINSIKIFYIIAKNILLKWFNNIQPDSLSVGNNGLFYLLNNRFITPPVQEVPVECMDFRENNRYDIFNYTLYELVDYIQSHIRISPSCVRANPVINDNYDNDTNAAIRAVYIYTSENDINGLSPPYNIINRMLIRTLDPTRHNYTSQQISHKDCFITELHRYITRIDIQDNPPNILFRGTIIKIPAEIAAATTQDQKVAAWNQLNNANRQFVLPHIVSTSDDINMAKLFISDGIQKDGILGKVIYEISDNQIVGQKICKKVEEDHGYFGENEKEWLFREDVIFEADEITYEEDDFTGGFYRIKCKPVDIYRRELNGFNTNFIAPGLDINLLY
jgi:hypothetical protein